MKDLFKGQKVRLSVMNAEEIGKALSSYGRDSELMRLMDTGPTRLHSAKAAEAFFEKMTKEPAENEHFFSIRSLEDDRLLGDINIEAVDQWLPRDAYVGIGIYKREDWGKGYGSDAMQLVLGFAFNELNLRRVSLTVFEYNPRAIRSYEKCGFQVEGRARGRLFKDGKHYDMICMGILYEEWKEKQK